MSGGIAAGRRGTLATLLHGALGEAAADAVLATLAIDPGLLAQGGPRVTRAAFAMALTAILFDDLLHRVPSGAAYVGDRRDVGARIVFDHGALRTIRFADGPTGALPGGIDAFARILVPLGYRVAGTYPLPGLRMTGLAFAHADLPAAIPQYFVSELHVDRFDTGFAEVAHRVFDTSRDPLDEVALAALDMFATTGTAEPATAAAALPRIAAAFGRQHGAIRLADYEALLAQSAEAGWIATEGNAFNHVTDRVADVDAVAARLRAGGRAIKDRVEVSANGRVRQTALRADPVERTFIGADAAPVTRRVPGSFYEFITRAVDPETGALDLTFDSGNATGIFGMTRTA